MTPALKTHDSGNETAILKWEKHGVKHGHRRVSESQARLRLDRNSLPFPPSIVLFSGDI